MITHEELCRVAVRWLNNRMVIGVSEISYASEIPDALGYGSYGTVLIECKTSRADFLRDGKKWCRKDSAKGLGNYRYFMCVEGLIKTDELPEKWGLLWVKNGKVYLKKGAKYYGHSGHEDWYFESARDSELGILAQVARRLRDNCPHIKRRLFTAPQEVRHE